MAFKVVLLYLALGLLWVIGSERLFSLFLSPQTVNFLHLTPLFKNLLFLLISAGVLYFPLRRLEKKEKQSNQQYKALFLQNPNPMWVYDRHRLCFLAINEAAIQQYGYSREAFLKMSIRDIRPPEDLPKLEEALQDGKKGFNNAGIFRHKRQDGSIFFVKIYSQDIYFEGKQARLVMALDYDEAKHFEESLMNQGNQLMALINGTPDLIWSVSKDLRLLAFNDAYRENVRRLSGVIPKENDPVIIESLPQELFQKWRKLYQSALNGEQFKIEESTPYLSGRVHYAEISFCPIYDQHQKVFAVACYARDITEYREQLNKIAFQNEQLREINWIQSHRFRAHVANILGLISIFNRESPEDPVNQAVLEKILLPAQALDDLVRQVTIIAETMQEAE